MREDGGLPGGGVDVGVDLCGEDGFVAEQCLDDAAAYKRQAAG